MRYGTKAFVAAFSLLPLAACGMIDGRDDRPRSAAALPAAPADAAYDSLPDAPAVPDEQPARPVAMAADGGAYLGAPYMIDGRTWTPAEVKALDEVGYAAVLWETAEGRRSVTGEAYVPMAISAAHRTLPLPSYVEVTALDTGRTILVRVSDRGPMLNDRVIALSPGAARQLGIAADGMAAVRVRKVNPPEQERDALRAGRPVAERMETPPGLRAALVKRLPARPVALAGPVRTASATVAPAAPAAPAAAAAPLPQPAPTPVVQTAPVVATVPNPAPTPAPALAAPAPVAAAPEAKLVEVRHSPPKPARPAAPVAAPAPVAAQAAAAPARGRFVVQVAALSTRAKADALAKSLGGFVAPAGKFFRVRTGPYGSDAQARAALGPIRAKGYADARVMANDGR